MRRKTPLHYDATLPKVVVYREDLEHLVSIFSMSGLAHVSFEYGDYIYDTLDDLRDAHGDCIRALRLCATPHDANYGMLSLSLTGYIVYLNCDATHELAFRQAKDFLATKHHWTSRVGSNFWFMAVPPVTTVLLWHGMRIMSADIATRGVVTGAVIGTLFVGLTLLLQRPNVIFLQRRHKYVGLLKRHEATIVKAIFGLAGSVVGYVLRLLQGG